MGRTGPAEIYMRLGRPTDSTMPLMWAHAEYVKLLRSAVDRKLFDLIPEVTSRYFDNRKDYHLLEIWKSNRQVARVKRGYTLRIQVLAPFRLHWSADEWQTVRKTLPLSRRR